jgi:hypothetical protein
VTKTEPVPSSASECTPYSVAAAAIMNQEYGVAPPSASYNAVRILRIHFGKYVRSTEYQGGAST